jgi:dihydroxyacetone kinase phosphoprotein-dependent L subunit
MTNPLREAILVAADRVEAAREELCALDAVTGDGDHGVTMAIGARNVRRRIAAVEQDDPAALVRAAALGMAGVGGAIGPIYTSALLACAGCIAQDSGGAATVAGLAACARAAADAVTGLGKARPGDKTIVDALVPVADALAGAKGDGADITAALEAARTAARAGADATVDMAATIGRSSRFGDRSRGAPDPGASSFALVVDALVSSALASLAVEGERG